MTPQLSKGIRLIQINLQHCKAATDLFVQKLATYDSCLALISEPWIHRGKIRGLNSQNSLVYQGSLLGRPRTCIVAKGVSFFNLTEFSTNDMTVGLLETTVNNTKTSVVVASVYLPGDSTEPPPSRELDTISRWCERKQLPLLIGGDFNAKHVTWGSAYTNRRGESITNFIARYNFDILNRGTAPTFCNGRHQSVIDVTIASQAISALITKWRVSEELTLSDHKYIEFTFGNLAVEESFFRNPKATNWNLFKKILNDRIRGRISTIRTRDEIDNEVCCLTSALTFAYETACPLKRRKSQKQVPWWNLDIAETRRRTHRAYLLALRTKSQENWSAYKDLKRTLKSLIRKSKRESWRKHCEDIDDVPAASRLQRVLRTDTTGKLGMLKRNDGTYTSSKEEMFEHLFETHFPGSQVSGVGHTPVAPNHRTMRRNGNFAEHFITIEKIEWAINTFKSFKSAGPDNIFPMLLQEGKDVVVPILYRIFKACIRLVYIPEAWKHAKVVFIPKSGKLAYDVAKSFRPICLLSFLLKVLERIIENEIKTSISNSGGLHPRQHAYQTGRSTESALHDVVTVIEQSLCRKQYCLGVFLDIQGAFDNASFKGIVRSLKHFSVNSTLVDIIEMMLRTRTVTCSSDDVDISRQVTRGCPQGGVLSPLLWNVLVDELLRTIDKHNIFCQFYADDGTLLVRSGTLQRLCSVMQRGLSVVEKWCRRNNMTVNPSKTVMVLFTRKLNTANFVAPQIFGEQLLLSDSVKYLGITLDKKLSWKANVEDRCGKATNALFLCRRAIGKVWGLRPSAVFWIYSAIIKPMVLYGSIVWWHRSHTNIIIGRLNRLQRLACLMITGCFKSTPTAALEAFLCLTPLHLAVQAEALASYKRLKRQVLWNDGNGHREIGELSRLIPELDMPEDRCTKFIQFNKKFKICIWDRNVAIGRHDQSVADGNNGTITCYTDGSRTADTECSGAGYYIKELDIRVSAPLGAYTTVFQSEIWAIKECVASLIDLGCSGKFVRIFSDSQASLKSLQRFTVTSKLVGECILALENLSSSNDVCLFWIPGHRGVEGNEVADELARTGSDTPFLGPEPVLGIGPSLILGSIKRFFHNKHLTYWANINTCRVSKLTVNSPTNNLAKQLLACSRTNLRAVIGILSNHNGLNYHLHNMGLADSPLCPLCGEGDESSIHLFCECPALENLRLVYFGTISLDPGDLASHPFYNLIGFGRRTGRWENLKGLV